MPKSNLLGRPDEQAILMGLSLADGKAVHLGREFLASGHLHIRGRTGAGKTSRAVLPLILQLLANAPTPTVPEPIFVFDLGGDRALFHCVREACQHAGRMFRFLSLNPDDDWHYFDPFQAASRRTERVIDLAEMLIEAFSLEYGPIYGGLYFTQQNLRALLRVAEHLVKRKASAREISIDDIAKFLDRNDKRVRDAEQIRATFEFLCQYRQLKPHLAPSTDQVIDLQRAIDEGEVIYFFLPSMGKSITVRPIAGLALYSLQQIAMRRPDMNLPIRRSWVFIDEFQSLAGRSFENFLAQCRKFGLSLVLCHQTLSQLQNKDSTLDDIVAKNTAVKLFFTAEGQEELDELQALSQTARVLLKGATQTTSTTQAEGKMKGTAFTTSRYNSATTSQSTSKSTAEGKSSAFSEREQIMPALEVNEIQEVSATDGQFFLVVNSGRGHTQPMPVQGLHLILREAHQAAQNRPLPKRSSEVEPATLSPPVSQQLQLPLSQAEGEPRNPERQHQLELLWQAVDERLLSSALPSPPKRQ